MDWLDISNYFVALLMICNPFAVVPIFLKITATDTIEERKKTSIVATCIVITIFIFSTWFGIPILKILGVQIAPFQFTGGMIILMLAISMFRAESSKIKQTPEERIEGIVKESVAATPLAIPLIAGPGAISTVIVEVSKHTVWLDQVILSLIAICVALVMGVILFFGSYVEKLLGRAGLNIFTRIGGLVVASAAIDTMSKSLIQIFPFLGR